MIEPQGLFDGVLQSRQILQRLPIWMFPKPNPTIISELRWLDVNPYSPVPDLALNFLEYIPMARELVDEPRNRDRDRVLHRDQL